jgi:metal-responsive CopG/Arc/MetJ family transcriptional regulator
MVSPSFSMSEELLQSFDETLNEMKREGEIDMDTRRSEVVREMMREWIEENRKVEEGNCQSTVEMAIEGS